ncbi:MAG: ComEC family competence protein [Chitinophagaceae bacterium]|nr:ComEC family competence protein [Chitinophagaceae bacterium]
MHEFDLGKFREKILKTIFFGFIGGIFLRSLFQIGFYFFIFIILVSITLAIIYFERKNKAKTFETENKLFIFLLTSIFLLCFALGVLRFNISESSRINSELFGYVDKQVSLKGTIVDEVESRENSTQLIFLTEKFINDGKEQKINDGEKILIINEQYPKYNYGDKIKITGKLTTPQNFEDQNGKIFDYKSYLAKDNIYYQIIFPKIELISSKNGNIIKSSLINLKKSFVDKLNIISPPQSLLLGGLLIGEKNSLGADLKEVFTRAGIIHIVVLSGYNITIVAESIIKFFSFLPRNFSFFIGSISIILFAIMTGGTATVMRAAIMAILVLLGRYLGRKYDVKRILFITGFLMILENPKILVFDPSFQLSFLATLGLIYVSPSLEKYFLFITERFGIRTILISTIATQALVLPLLLYKTGNFSVVALLVNIIVLPLIPITMFLGFITGVFGFINYYLALFPAFITNYFLLYIIKTASFFASLPFSVIKFENISIWFVILCYIFVYIFLRYSKNKI